MVPRTQTPVECARATEELLARDDPPDAVFALTERVAVNVGQTLGELRFAVPDEVRLLAGSDGERAAHAPVPISAIDLHPEEVGAAAVALLSGRIEGLDTERPRIVRATLTARESTTGRRDGR